MSLWGCRGGGVKPHCSRDWWGFLSFFGLSNLAGSSASTAKFLDIYPKLPRFARVRKRLILIWIFIGFCFQIWNWRAGRPVWKRVVHRRGTRDIYCDNFNVLSLQHTKINISRIKTRRLHSKNLKEAGRLELWFTSLMSHGHFKAALYFSPWMPITPTFRLQCHSIIAVTKLTYNYAGASNIALRSARRTHTSADSYRFVYVVNEVFVFPALTNFLH